MLLGLADSDFSAGTKYFESIMHANYAKIVAEICLEK